MKTQANRWAGNFFESYSFLDSLSDGVQYLGFEMSGDIMTRDEVPSDVEYGGEWINLCGNDLDYYVTTHDEGTELGIVGIVVVFGIVVTGILFSDHIEMERRFLINIDHTACAHIQISDDSLFGIVEIDVT